MKSFFSWPRLLVVLLAVAMFAAVWAGSSTYRRYWLRQRGLAAEFGVRMGDYPNPDTFPIGYFRSELHPGMAAADVHAIVRGYEAVYRCDGKRAEVYYYFTREDARALRFVISYASDLSFDSLGTEDPGQRTISIAGCIPGRLEE